MDVPFVVRYCGEHHELVNALIDHLGEFIQTAEIGQNIRHELDMGCNFKKVISRIKPRFKELVVQDHAPRDYCMDRRDEKKIKVHDNFQRPVNQVIMKLQSSMNR